MQPAKTYPLRKKTMTPHSPSSFISTFTRMSATNTSGLQFLLQSNGLGQGIPNSVGLPSTCLHAHLPSSLKHSFFFSSQNVLMQTFCSLNPCCLPPSPPHSRKCPSITHCKNLWPTLKQIRYLIKSTSFWPFLTQFIPAACNSPKSLYSSTDSH